MFGAEFQRTVSISVEREQGGRGGKRLGRRAYAGGALADGEGPGTNARERNQLQSSNHTVSITRGRGQSQCHVSFFPRARCSFSRTPPQRSQSGQQTVPVPDTAGPRRTKQQSRSSLRTRAQHVSTFNNPPSTPSGGGIAIRIPSRAHTITHQLPHNVTLATKPRQPRQTPKIPTKSTRLGDSRS